MAEFGKLNFAVAFNPQTAFPLDARYYFSSKTDADAAAATAVEVGSSTGTYFYGQNLVVVADNKATLYVIQPDKTLKAVGTTPVGDNETIIVDENGKISLKIPSDFTEGMILSLNAEGKVVWTEPDTTTVTGLETTIGQLGERIGILENSITQVFTYEGKLYLKDNKYYKNYENGNFTDELDILSMPEGDERNEYIGNVYTVEKYIESPVGSGTYIVENPDSNEEIVWEGSKWVSLGSAFTGLENSIASLRATVEEHTATIGTINGEISGLNTEIETAQTGVDKLTTFIGTENLADSSKHLTDFIDEKIDNKTGELKINETTYNTVKAYVDAADGNLLSQINTTLTNDYAVADHTHEGLYVTEQEYISDAPVIQIKDADGEGNIFDKTSRVVTIPTAIATKLGLVKGQTKETTNNGINIANANKIFVSEDEATLGQMNVLSIDAKTLVQGAGEELTLDGGTASVRA